MLTLYQDIQQFAETFPLAKDLKDSKFLITGATGLIGSTLVRCLESLDKNIDIFCPVRNINKAQSKFQELRNTRFVETDLVEYLNSLDESLDYIIHCASPTAGKYVTEHPVETYELAILSTNALLRYAINTPIKGMVYISSLEVYGQILDDKIITEDEIGYVNPSDPRSSYPLGKRAAEFLCTSYAKEYGIPAKIARLTQTFGAGVATDDNRVFAQFARSVIKGEDIVLHTTGESAKPYCYTTDCASAILHILLRGANGEAYNVANDETYISIRDMAQFLCDKFNPAIDIRVEFHPEMGYAPVTKLNLSADKLKSLGWKPSCNVDQMFTRLIESFK